MDIKQAIKNKHLLKYRQGSIGLILNQDNKVLIVQMNEYKKNEWRFPGGGIDKGEDAGSALLRELNEELGSDKFEIVAQSKFIAKFDWPDESIRKRYERKGEIYKGQEQRQFLVNFSGSILDLKPDPNELKNVKWISLDELPEFFIFPGQWEITKKVIEELINN